MSAGGEDVPLERRVKGFMPFCRLSHNLLAACDARYREGLSGHSEVIWPTIASLAGLLLEDIGGSGSFTSNFLIHGVYARLASVLHALMSVTG